MCRHTLGIIGRPWSRYLLGRREARLDFLEGREIVLNCCPVNSRYVGPTLFYHRAQKAGPNTLYRIRVKPKIGVHAK